MRRKFLLRKCSLSPSKTIDGVDHWGEVFPLLMAGSKVLVLLLLLHLGKALLGLSIPIGTLIGISDSEIKDAITAALPESAYRCITSLLSEIVSLSS